MKNTTYDVRFYKNEVRQNTSGKVTSHRSLVHRREGTEEDLPEERPGGPLP
ncbi:hypothetical protein ACIBQ1_61555 [Nonomuraea sp. NPDC050153]|uniref:hypothetical protein n=1 Tax=Nonomuraea sp. NPDC050153 TaxID=3364359 RepID=UPI00379850CC